MLQLGTTGVEAVLTPGHDMNKVDRGSYGDTYYQNIKALFFPVLDKKNLEVVFFVLRQRSTWRCYTPNIKALGQAVSGKNFEIFFLCSYIATYIPPHPAGPVLIPGASYKQTW